MTDTAIPKSHHSTGQAGEYLVAAELARQGFTVALPTGNAPDLDILAYRGGKTFAVQVKAVARGSHQFNLRKFVDIELQPDGVQKMHGPLDTLDPYLILALVFVGESVGQDELIWTTVCELAELLAREHQNYLDRHGGRRPQNPTSMHTAISRKIFREQFGKNSLEAVFGLPELGAAQPPTRIGRMDHPPAPHPDLSVSASATGKNCPPDQRPSHRAPWCSASTPRSTSR